MNIIITLNSMFPCSMCKISHDNERSTTLSRIDKKKLSIEKQRGDTASAA